MKIAIIGLGNIGKVHASVLALQKRHVVALCDVDAERAERIRGEFAPDAKVYADYREMVEVEAPDVVHVCTPHDLHAEMVIYLLSRGINVLCEKPLCINEAELVAIIEAAARSTARLGVCHQNRYNSPNKFAKEYLKDKEIVGAHGSVVWHRDEKYYAEAPWRASKARAGGGALINQALHTLDLCGWFCGQPKKVTAKAENLAHRGQIEVEDTLTAVFSEGASFTFFATTASACSLPVEISIGLASGDKLIVLPHTVLENGRVIFEEKRIDFHGKECYGNSHEALVSDFYDCVESGRAFPTDAVEAAKVMRLIFAAYKSDGETVEV